MLGTMQLKNHFPSSCSLNKKWAGVMRCTNSILLFKWLVCDSNYVCVCLCDVSVSCDCNHEAASDPARSLSGFTSFSSQGIFGIVVSDTLIVMGRPGCQWSAWISILLGSARRATATWCNRSLSCFQCWQRSRCPLTHQVAYLWAGEKSFFFPEVLMWPERESHLYSHWSLQ